MIEENNWINKIQSQTKRVHSQKNQDGKIEYIFDNIGTTNKFCVEFGFNSKTLTGGSGPNIARLVKEDEWECLLLDSHNENESINLYKEPLTYDNIGKVFSKYNVPMEPDYVSIDVDSIDLWLMKGMLESGYKPRLISIEYNSNYPLGFSYTVTRKEKSVPFVYNGGTVYGASLTALNNAAEEFGYSLIGVEMQHDLFFIRNDLLTVPPPPITDFEKFTNIPCHGPSPINRFLEYVVEYPLEVELSIENIKKLPNFIAK